MLVAVWQADKLALAAEADSAGSVHIPPSLKGLAKTGLAKFKSGQPAVLVDEPGGAAALAGYVSDAQGRPWALAMLVNDGKAAAAKPALEAFVDHLARFGPGEARTQGSPQRDGP